MHFNHIVVVKANDKKDAIQKAEEFLEPYGKGDVWDWFEIGGRWSWKKNDDQYHSDKIANVLKISDDRKKAEQIIKYQLKTQTDEIKACNRYLIDEMKRSKIYKLSDLKQETAGMIGYYLHKIGGLLGGYYQTGSYFYDVDYGAAYISDKRIKEILKADDLFLVNLDLHN
jgi:hypothetical protein